MRILSILCLWALSIISVQAGDLSVGDLAPDFSLQGSDGDHHGLLTFVIR